MPTSPPVHHPDAQRSTGASAPAPVDGSGARGAGLLSGRAVGQLAAAALPLAGATVLAVNVGRRVRAAKQVRRQAVPHKTYWDGHEVEGEFTYVALGDSAAQGVGVRNPGHSYVGLVSDRLRKEIAAPVRTRNLSVSGATTTTLIETQLPLFESLVESTNVVSCVIGANDVIRMRFDIGAFKENIDTIASALPAGSVLGEVPSMGYRPFESRVVAANGVIGEAAERHGHHLAQVYSATRQLWPATILQHSSEDYFHPNELGYRVWAGAVWDGMERALAA